MVKHLLLVFSIIIGTTVSAQTRVFLIGDSTTETWKGPSWYPCQGWGAVLQYFFDINKVVVDNRAVGGTTTKSFYNEHWAKVISDIGEGDFLFISFGANDSNLSATYCTTTEEFINYIGIFCNEARAKGATPVLLSTVNQNSWNSQNLLNSSYGQHPKAMKEAADKYETPFIDLYSFGFNLSKEVGQEYNTFYRHNNYKPGEYDNYPEGKKDNVHLQEMGAIDYSRYIVEEIEKSKDERLKILADATTPRYYVTFEVDNDSMMTSISRSATFPEGINVTLKSYGVDENKKCFWKNASGEIISKNHVYVYVMENHDEHFMAIYNDTSVPQPLTEDYKIYNDRIVFYDNKNHTVSINTFNGRFVTSASTKYNYSFNLQTGVYILTIDGIKSTKIIIK